MRIRTLALTLTLACGLAAAASKQEPVTYVEGDVTGVAPNSGGSLILTGETAIELKTGLASVSVPYSNISKAELGATRTHGSDEPLYKVWTLHKHIFKTETQFLKVQFTDVDGAQRNMTVELSKSAAPEVLGLIEEHNPAASPRKDASVTNNAAWWGDKYWKTNRNTDQWQKGAPDAH